MQSSRNWWSRRWRGFRNRSNGRKASRPTGGRPKVGFEQLETRNMLSVTLDPASMLTGQDWTAPDGKFFFLPLNSQDTNSNATVSYQVTSTDQSVVARAIVGGITLDLNVSGVDGNGNAFRGDVTILLLGEYAPNTVQHIENLVQEGFYNGLDFFRVADLNAGTGGPSAYIAQTGSSTNDGQGGSSLGPIFDEYASALTFNGSPGLLAMADSGHDTDDSQFFLTDTNTGTSYESQGDFSYTIAGQVTSGFDILQDIMSTQVNGSSPTTPVVINSAKLINGTVNTVMQIYVPAGYSSTDTINITATDSDGNTASTSVGITGQADTVQDPPFFSPPFGNSAPFTVNPNIPTVPTLSTPENTAVTFKVPVTDTNLNLDATVSASLWQYDSSNGEYDESAVDASASYTFSKSTSTTGVLTVTITPTAGFSGNANLELQVTDDIANNTGGPDNERFTLDAVAPLTVDPTGLLSSQTTWTNSDGRYLYLPLNSQDTDSSATVSYQVTQASDGTPRIPSLVIQGGATLDLNVSGTLANGYTYNGDITILLMGEYAPETVAHIESLVDSGFYTSEQFFRVIDGLAQAGSPTNNGQGGSTLGDLYDEYSSHITFSGSPGLVAMANGGHNTADSQFFITDPSLGSYYESAFDFDYSIFGQVTSGFNILEDIMSAPVQANSSGEDSQPTAPIVINSAKLIADPLDTVLQLYVPAGDTSTTTFNVTATDSDEHTSSTTFSVTGVADTITDPTTGDTVQEADPPFFTTAFGTSAPFTPNPASPASNPSAPTVPTLTTTASTPISFTAQVTDLNPGATLTESLLEYSSTDGAFEPATDATATYSYVATSGTTGKLTVTITPAAGAVGEGSFALEIYDDKANNPSDSNGNPIEDYEQFSLNVLPAGFAQQGSTLTVTGSSANDTFQVQFASDGSVVQVTSNGVSQDFATGSSNGAINQIVFNGVSGNDTLSAVADPIAAATATLSASTLSIVSSVFNISASNIAQIVFNGKASDTANMTDAPGANTLIVASNGEEFEGTNFTLTAVGAGNTNAYSNGHDSVTVSAAGAKYFSVNSTSGYLGNSTGLNGPGEKFFNFPTVNANDSSSKVVATVFGNGSSAFKDTITVGTMTSKNFFVQVTNFAEIDNVAGGAGDTIELDTTGNQEYVAGASAYINRYNVANSQIAWAVGFQTVKAVAGSTSDIAVFIGGVKGNQNLTASGYTANLTNANGTYIATNFARVVANQSTGFDTDHVGVIDFVLTKNGTWYND